MPIPAYRKGSNMGQTGEIVLLLALVLYVLLVFLLLLAMASFW